MGRTMSEHDEAIYRQQLGGDLYALERAAISVNTRAAWAELVAERAHSARLAERVAELEQMYAEMKDAADKGSKSVFALAASQAENVRLRRFCDRCWDIARDGCDMDGAEIQESLVACGFLVGTKRTEACGENCRCAEYFGTDEPWTCYEPVPPSPTAALREVHVVFDGPPSHESGRFVECEDGLGNGISAGKWVQVGDLWHLVIANVLGPEVRT